MGTIDTRPEPVAAAVPTVGAGANLDTLFPGALLERHELQA